jgi:purine-nucleoside phosphorylase
MVPYRYAPNAGETNQIPNLMSEAEFRSAWRNFSGAMENNWREALSPHNLSRGVVLVIDKPDLGHRDCTKISTLHLQRGIFAVERTMAALRGSPVQALVALLPLTSIRPELSLGDIVAPSAAIRDEGLTDTYVPVEIPADADFQLTDLLVTVLERQGRPPYVGPCWSSSAECAPENLADRAYQFYRLGVLGQAAALAPCLALAALHGIAVSALCIVSDSLFKPNPPDAGQLADTWRAAYTAAQAALESYGFSHLAAQGP